MASAGAMSTHKAIEEERWDDISMEDLKTECRKMGINCNDPTTKEMLCKTLKMEKLERSLEALENADWDNVVAEHLLNACESMGMNKLSDKSRGGLIRTLLNTTALSLQQPSTSVDARTALCKQRSVYMMLDGDFTEASIKDLWDWCFDDGVNVSLGMSRHQLAHALDVHVKSTNGSSSAVGNALATQSDDSNAGKAPTSTAQTLTDLISEEETKASQTTPDKSADERNYDTLVNALARYNVSTGSNIPTHQRQVIQQKEKIMWPSSVKLPSLAMELPSDLSAHEEELEESSGISDDDQSGISDDDQVMPGSRYGPGLEMCEDPWQNPYNRGYEDQFAAPRASASDTDMPDVDDIESNVDQVRSEEPNKAPARYVFNDPNKPATLNWVNSFMLQQRPDLFLNNSSDSAIPVKPEPELQQYLDPPKTPRKGGTSEVMKYFRGQPYQTPSTPTTPKPKQGNQNVQRSPLSEANLVTPRAQRMPSSDDTPRVNRNQLPLSDIHRNVFGVQGPTTPESNDAQRRPLGEANTVPRRTQRGPAWKSQEHRKRDDGSEAGGRLGLSSSYSAHRKSSSTFAGARKGNMLLWSDGESDEADDESTSIKAKHHKREIMSQQAVADGEAHALARSKQNQHAQELSKGLREAAKSRKKQGEMEAEQDISEQSAEEKARTEQAEKARAEQAEKARAEQAEKARAEQAEKARAEEAARAEQAEKARAEQAEKARAEEAARAEQAEKARAEQAEKARAEQAEKARAEEEARAHKAKEAREAKEAEEKKKKEEQQVRSKNRADAAEARALREKLEKKQQEEAEARKAKEAEEKQREREGRLHSREQAAAAGKRRKEAEAQDKQLESERIEAERLEEQTRMERESLANTTEAGQNNVQAEEPERQAQESDIMSQEESQQLSDEMWRLINSLPGDGHARTPTQADRDRELMGEYTSLREDNVFKSREDAMAFLRKLEHITGQVSTFGNSSTATVGGGKAAKTGQRALRERCGISKELLEYTNNEIYLPQCTRIKKALKAGNIQDLATVLEQMIDSGIASAIKVRQDNAARHPETAASSLAWVEKGKKMLDQAKAALEKTKEELEKE